MNFIGLIVGIILFFFIGSFHPLVIKAEYYFGKRIWWTFFVAGVILSLCSMLIDSEIASMIVGTMGFGMFWSTIEIFKQHKRVLLGRAKRNPNRKYESLMLAVAPISISLNFSGIIVGAATFLIMAAGHYSCIKAEYYFTKKSWIAYLVLGIVGIILSLFAENLIVSAIMSIFGFTCLWGIGEVIQQEKRVEKGWFPKNPKRK